MLSHKVMLQVCKLISHRENNRCKTEKVMLTSICSERFLIVSSTAAPDGTNMMILLGCWIDFTKSRTFLCPLTGRFPSSSALFTVESMRVGLAALGSM